MFVAKWPKALTGVINKSNFTFAQHKLSIVIVFMAAAELSIALILDILIIINRVFFFVR